MKILYGVVGEGMGHATRSHVILDHLVQRHEVRIVVSGRAHGYLKKRFPDVLEIEGLRIRYEDNEVDRSKTFWDLLKRLPAMVGGNFDRFKELGEDFRPDAVISDFESFAYLFAKDRELPVISVDNMQIINRCELDPELDREDGDFQIAKAIVKAKLPGCYHYLITTFFFPPVRKERTSLFPPILRDAVLDAEPTVEDHLLVYQTSTTNERLLDILREVGLPCRVYGFGREEQLGDIALRAFSDKGFVRDLASCRGVLATGGFSLMGEAIYLGKPMLAVPVGKQHEQLINAFYLQKLGYGEHHRELTAASVRAFHRNAAGYAAALKGHRQQRNSEILAALDGLLAELDGRRLAR